MARFRRKKGKPAADRIQEHHKEFSARIIKQIKDGVAPWQKPWKPGEKFLPENFKTGTAYRGTNTLNLASVAIDRGYSDNRWGTYKQIKAAGGYVRAGEKGSGIIYYSTHWEKAVKDSKGRRVKDKDGKQVYEQVPRVKPFPKRYTVFNVEQANRLNLPERPEPPATWKTHDKAERVIRASGVDFNHVPGDKAAYNLSQDRVTMPPRDQFPDAGGYYQTALHEVAHATGHPDRLNRESLKDAVQAGFGSQSYAREELRAEISSMMTNTRLDIGHDSRHGAAYVEDWVEALEDNPKEIVDAARDAQRMSAYMLERGRELADRDAQGQPAAGGGGSKDQEIQYQKTGPDRFEYRQGERTAVIDKIPNTHDSHSVTMGDRSGPALHSVNCKTPHEALTAVREYLSTGRTPEPPASGPDRSPSIPAPADQRGPSPSPDRDDEPSR